MTNPLNYKSIGLQIHCITNLLHYKSIALQIHCITNPFHYKSIALQIHCITNPLHYKSIALQIHCITNPLHYKSIGSQMYQVDQIPIDYRSIIFQWIIDPLHSNGLQIQQIQMDCKSIGSNKSCLITNPNQATLLFYQPGGLP